MLSKLIIQDFQSWKSLELELSPVVVIVGETDSGKSAILRAFSAVLFNALEGASFVKKGASRASITVTTDSGDAVTLERGASVNRYVLNGKTLDKIGRDVPAAVSSALQIEEVVFEEGGSLTLQFQPQMDAPFLLTDQGVRATRLLGSVSKVATLYKAARVAGQRSKDTSSSLKLHQLATEQCRSRLAWYDGLQEVQPKIVLLQMCLTNKQMSRERLEKLQLIARRFDLAYDKSYNLDIKASFAWQRHDTAQRKVAAATSLEKAYLLRERLEVLLVRSKGFRDTELRLQLNMCAYGDRVSKYEQLEQFRAGQKKLRGAVIALNTLAVLEVKELRSALSVVKLHEQVQFLEKEFLCPTCGRET